MVILALSLMDLRLRRLWELQPSWHLARVRNDCSLYQTKRRFSKRKLAEYYWHYRRDTPVYRQPAPVPLWLSFVPAKSSKSIFLTPPYCGDFRSHAWFIISCCCGCGCGWGTHREGDIILVFMWVPSHVGLAGNSAVDIASEATLLLPMFNLIVPHWDYNSLIRILEQ